MSTAAYRESHRAELREKARQHNREYAATHREECRARCRAYYEAHKEERAEAMRAYRLANPNKYREGQRACYAAHRKQRNAHSRAYNAAHREQINATSRARRVAQGATGREARRQARQCYRDALRAETLAAYGGPLCACCGETEPRFLELDHINNDGAAWRRAHGIKTGRGTYQVLKREGYPPGYQVLCSNCNQGRARNGGVCPHQKGKK